MKKIYIVLSVLLISILLSNVASARIEIPGRTRSWVNDYAGIIDKETREYLEGLISSVEQKTKDPVEVIIATFKSLEGWPVDEFATKYGEKWRQSKSGRDNGVIILVALKEQRVNIGVGRNLRNVLTDSKAQDIIQQTILPEFSKGDYSQGVKKAVEIIVGTVSGAEIPKDSPIVILLNIFKILLVVLVVIILFIIGSRRTKP